MDNLIPEKTKKGHTRFREVTLTKLEMLKKLMSARAQHAGKIQTGILQFARLFSRLF